MWRGSTPEFSGNYLLCFKSAETETNQGTASTGWETFIGLLLQLDFLSWALGR